MARQDESATAGRQIITTVRLTVSGSLPYICVDGRVSGQVITTARIW